MGRRGSGTPPCLFDINTILITHIHHTWEDADTFFPEIDPTIWSCIDQERHEVDEKHAYAFTFATYKRVNG